MKKVCNTIAIYMKSIVRGVLISYQTLMSWLCIVTLILLKDILTNNAITEQPFINYMISYAFALSIIIWGIKLLGDKMCHPVVELLAMLVCNALSEWYVLTNNMPLSSVKIEWLLCFSIGIHVLILVLEIFIRFTKGPDFIIRARKVGMPEDTIAFWDGVSLEDAYCRVNNELAKLPEDGIELEDRRTTVLLNTLDYIETALAEKYMKENGYIFDTSAEVGIWKKS